MSVISYDTVDASGYRCDLRLIGRKYRHQDGAEYIVGGYSWDADRARWMIGFKSAHSNVVFMRLPEFFFGQRNGRPRFVPVQ